MLTADHRLLRQDYARTALPAEIDPGKTIEVPVSITLPSAETPYILKLDLVSEGVCWFEEVGSRPVSIRI